MWFGTAGLEGALRVVAADESKGGLAHASHTGLWQEVTF